MGSAEMKSDFYRHKFYRDENSGHRWGGKNINHFTFGPGRYYMSTLSLGCFPHLSTPPPPDRNAIFLHFWLQIACRDLGPVPFYHLTAALSVPFRPKWTLHLLRWQFTCLHLIRAICEAKCQDSERGGGCQRPDYFSPLIPECIAHPRGMGFWDILASYEFETRRYKSPSMDV